MKLYLKLLRYLKPFWKLIILSIVLTLFFIFFNNLSLWISVDFIRELFEPQNLQELSQINQQNPANNQPGIESISNPESTYEKINQVIKSYIIQENRFATLKMVCFMIFFSYLLKNIIHYIRRVLNNFIELRILLNIRNDLFSTIIRLPLTYFERNHTGRLTSIVFNDVNAVNIVLANSFGKLILIPLQLIANLVILLLISWKLSIITFTIVPLTGFVIVKIGKSIRRKSRRVFRQIANVVSVFQESVSSIRIVKAFTNEDRQETSFRNESYRHYKLNFRANKLSFFTSPLNETLGVFILVALLWYGGNMVYSGEGLTAEDFMRYLVFLFTVFQPLKELGGLNNRIQTGLAAAERIFDTIDEHREVYEKPDSKKLDQFQHSIKFEGVNFRYHEDEPIVLENINLDIKRGDMVAFVGPSGAGKSTLVDLIPRFYDIQEGSIRIDGTDVREFTLESLRSKIGVVSQDSILFNDTVKLNIAYGLNGVSEEKIIDAAKAANAWEFICKMEDGLNTIIGEKGIKLSGGQKQRLSIARAILKNSPILILDEATSALDSISEKLVQEAIDQLMENRTVLVIAHRLSTIIHADKIVVLDQGKIVGHASHLELLEDCQAYRSLYKIQFRHQLEQVQRKVVNSD